MRETVGWTSGSRIRPPPYRVSISIQHSYSCYARRWRHFDHPAPWKPSSPNRRVAPAIHQTGSGRARRAITLEHRRGAQTSIILSHRDQLRQQQKIERRLGPRKPKNLPPPSKRKPNLRRNRQHHQHRPHFRRKSRQHLQRRSIQSLQTQLPPHSHVPRRSLQTLPA